MSGSYWAHALGGGQKHPSISVCSPILLSLFSDPLLWRKKLQSPSILLSLAASEHTEVTGSTDANSKTDNRHILSFCELTILGSIFLCGKNMTSKIMGTLKLGFTTVIPYNHKTLKVDNTNEFLWCQMTILQILHMNLFPNNKFWVKVDFYNTDYL